jgi:hypothetical protein
MRRTLAVVFVAATLVGAFTLGLYRGVDMGIEEYARLYPTVVIFEPCPIPTPLTEVIPSG